jgi:hypothetical protein
LPKGGPLTGRKPFINSSIPMLVLMKIEVKSGASKRSRINLEEFSSDPIARAVRGRLAKLQLKQIRDEKSLFRQARQLRRKMIKDARSSRGQ